ncbi:MAG TPA: hypothetical protein VG734_03870 [Lacunisphaera sp.]|nr:hypothetical protein [Lacunisphaera sp.]
MNATRVLGPTPPRFSLGWSIAALPLAAAFAAIAPDALLSAWRFAAVAALALPLGALFWTLLLPMTGARWGDDLKPWWTAWINVLPVLWLVALPPWAPLLHTSAPWPHYDSAGMAVVRVALPTAVLCLLARLAVRTARRQGTAAVAFIVLVFTLHPWLDDLATHLTPGWHSTAFPLLWMTGAASAAFATALLLRRGAGREREAARARGNLLLATATFWCYLGFAQYLIIWEADLPRETAWFFARRAGAWALVPPAIALAHFAAPLGLLLFRRVSASRAGLSAAAGAVVVGQLLFNAWIVLPAPPANPVQPGWLPALLAAPVLIVLVAPLLRLRPDPSLP